MSKTFTCRELGGICDEKFSGNFLMEIVDKAMHHMMYDDAHMTSIKNMEKSTGESQEQWIARMQKEFDARSEDKQS